MRTVSTALLLLLTGCYVGVETYPPPGTTRGDLTVYYTFDGRDCESAGVDLIDVKLYGLNQGDSYTAEVSCTRYTQGITIESLEQDTYELTIEARGYDGGLLYRLDALTYVDVWDDSHNSYDIDIPGSIGDLTIYWTFDGFGSCGLVDDVRVTLIDRDDFIVDDARYDCEVGGVVYEQLPEGSWYVLLEGIDDADRIIFRSGDRDVEVVAAAENSYTIDLGTVW